MPPAPDTEQTPEIAYQPVSSGGLEHPMDDSLISFGQEPSYQEIPSSDDLSHLFDEDEEAEAKTLRVPPSIEEEPLPPTQPSSDLVSGIRLAPQGSERAPSMEPSTDGSRPQTAYEMTVQGMIKTAGDRNLPPYVPASLDPDTEKKKDGRDAA